MQCKICREKTTKDDMVQVRNGCICHSCFDGLPDSVKANITKFTVRQIFQLGKLVRPHTSKMWIESGVFGIGKESLCVKGNEYLLKDLRKVRLNFHPREIGSHPNTVVGTITVILETRMPHFLIEEPFFPGDVTVGYGISGKTVYYHYSYEMEQLMNFIQDCIDDKSYDMTAYIVKYKKTIQKAEESKRMKAATGKEKAPNGNAGKRKDAGGTGFGASGGSAAKKTGWQETKQANSYGFNNMHRAKKLSPFEEAKALFNVEMPYTMLQIKEARNFLMKKYHPDNTGGSDEMCKRVNEAYTLLSKFASQD